MNRYAYEPPKYLQIEPARSCNLSCVHCVHGKEGGLMSFSTFNDILRANPYCEYIKFQGLGEPLLNTDLPTMCRDAHTFGVFTEVLSNGTIIPSPTLLSHVDLYGVSIETLDPERYQATRGSHYDRLMRTLDVLAADFDGKVFINCTRTEWNTPEEVAEVGEMCFVNGWNFCNPLQESWRHDSGDAIASAYRAATVHQVPVNKNREQSCPWLKEKAYYDFMGNIHPCCIRMEDRYILGTEWNGQTVLDFRKERERHPWCVNCPY